MSDSESGLEHQEVVRLGVNLAPDVADALRRMATENGCSITVMVGRCITDSWNARGTTSTNRTGDTP